MLLAGAVGYLLGEVYAQGGGLVLLPLAVVIALLSAAGSYFAGDRLVLAISRAREVSPEEEPGLHDIVDALAAGTGIPKPRVYVIEEAAPNAFATGRDPQHASVAVTRGLLRMMDRPELEGVLAHELSHVRNFDTRFLLIVTVLVGMVAILSNLFLRSLWFGGGRRRRDSAGGILAIVGIVLAILAPIAAQLIRFAVSRQREYLADASGALLTRYPAGLAGALRKIAASTERLPAANDATAPLYFANPLKRAGSLFDTHPPIEERIRRLESM